MSDLDKYVIIGAGGIGGYLALPLMRYLEYLHENYGGFELKIIDGDSFEDKNLERQVCSTDSIGFNKARWLAGMLSIFKRPNTLIEVVDEYLNKENIEKHLKYSYFIFSCVDNDKTRVLVQDYCSNANIPMINGGNEYVDGNVQMFLPGISKRLDEVHKDMLKSKDHNPGDGCVEQSGLNPQLSVANNLVASLMLVQFYKWSTDMIDENLIESEVTEDETLKYRKMLQSSEKIKNHELFFDMNTGEVVGYDRTSKPKRDA